MRPLPLPRRRGPALVAALALSLLAASLAGPQRAAAEARPPAPAVVGADAQGRALTPPAPAPEAAPGAASGAGEWDAFPGTGEAAPAPLVVIGDDTRYRVTDTTAYPNRAIVYLTTSAYRCTGFLVSADTVVTAGHCVHPGRADRDFYSAFRAHPGRNGAVSPYGSCGHTEVWTSQAWATTGDRREDWGVLKLDCAIGTTTGWLGHRWQDATHVGNSVNLRGYPGDKPEGTMWSGSGRIRSETPTNLRYEIDTYDGQSGSPVFDLYGEDWQAIGVHTYGPYQTCCNGGTRITPAIAAFLADVR
ncbi:trypsin-like serine peptidase [Streptomyces sp. SBT349]|uniref:trypsin-like serine peptidase n=1 Tax=Streptomyces sp. SBT349 TaxID=1580539 RepID=UPI00066B826E|nr:serine protease [Streptomyces sp. SBT349]